MNNKWCWHDIEALDEEALNRAVEPLFGRTAWRESPHKELGAYTWMHQFEGGGAVWSTVPHLQTTTHWEPCMQLLWHYNITIGALRSSGGTPCRWVGFPTGKIIVETEAAARVAICRLALWEYLLEETTGVR